MITIDEMLEEILRTEGGFTADPKDRAHYGKADPARGRRWDCACTNMGITQATLSDYYGRQATLDEVKSLSRELAKEIYETRYVTGPRFHTMPVLIQPVLIDAGVHSGPRRSVRWLQEVLNMAGYGPLSTDGAIGPSTRAAAEKAASEMGAWLVNALIEQRRQFLEGLIASDPSQERFRRGWLARLSRLEMEVA